MAERRRRQRNATVDALQVLGGQYAMTLIGIVNGVITARWLGPAGRGQFQLLTLLPTMLSNFVKLGIPQASVYFMRRRGASASAVASNSLWFAVVMGGAAAVICWYFRDWLLANVLKDTPAILLAPSLALIPFVLLQFYLLGVAQAQERFREYNIRQVVPNLLALVGLTITLVLLHMGLVGAVLVQVVIQVFMTAWMTWRVHREAPLRMRVDAELARGMLSFGGKSYVQTLVATQHRRLDQFICAYFLTPAAVGVYAIAVNFSGLLLSIAESAGTVLFPRLAGLAERDAHAATCRVCRQTLFILAVGGLAFAVVGPLAIPLLYGRKFDGAVVPLLITLPGLLPAALYQLLTRNFTSRGKQEINIAAAVTALVTNIGFNVALIPRWGISGAALAHGLSYGAAALMLLVAFRRDSGHTLGETLIVRPREVRELAVRGWRIAGRLRGRPAA